MPTEDTTSDGAPVRSPAAPPARPDIPALTGLRGIAALMVVLTHYFAWCATFDPRSAPPWLVELFHWSDDGMTLFFTLSGFVIAYNYFDFDWDKTPVRSLARFAWLRFSRLYPALLVFIVLTSNPRSLQNLTSHPFDIWMAAHVLNVESWLPFKFQGVLPVNGTFSVIWSISTEFMLYFIFASALIAGHLFHQRGRTNLFVALLTVMFAGLLMLALFPATRGYFYATFPTPLEPLTEQDWDRWFFYLSPYFRITNFATGAAAALLILYQRSLIEKYQVFISRAAVTALLLFVALHFAETIGQALTLLHPNIPAVQVFTALLFAIIMLDGRSKSPINRVLNWDRLVMIGNMSFSLYLFHQFMPRLGIYFHPELTFRWLLMPRFAVNFAMSLLLSLAFAYGLWLVVERPSQKWLRSLMLWRPTGVKVRDAAPAE